MNEPMEALEKILNVLEPVTTEHISLFEGHGRVIASSVISRRFIPPADTSTMDGYAVKQSDIQKGVPLQLKVNGVIPAGNNTSRLTTGEGTCWRIMTGAALPPGTDMIIPHENTDNSSTLVTINEANLNRLCVRYKGEEAQVGDEIYHVGERLDMARMAKLAARGIHYLPVYRKPRIAVFSSGNEVVDAMTQDLPEKIFDSNSIAIKAILESAGCEVNYLGVLQDDPGIIAESLSNLKGYDMIVSSGGASAGDFDYFVRQPEQLGIKWHFSHIRQRPAQPISFGIVNNIPIFSLPGTPVGSILCATLYVKPAARRLAGYMFPKNTNMCAILAEPVDKRVDCSQFNTAYCIPENGALMAYPKPLANYSLKQLAQANAFIHLKRGKAGTVEAGTVVDAIFFGDLSF